MHCNSKLDFKIGGSMKIKFRSGLFLLIILMFLFADIGIISKASDNLTIKIPNQLFLVKTATPTPTPKFKVVEMLPIQPIMPIATAPPPPPPPPTEPAPVWQVMPFEPFFPIATAVPTWDIGLIEDLPFYEIATPIPDWETKSNSLTDRGSRLRSPLNFPLQVIKCFARLHTTPISLRRS